MAWVHGAAKLRAIFSDPAWCHFWQWVCICLAIALKTCLGISLPCFGNADTFPCASHFWQCWHMPTYAAIFGNFHSSCKASARLCPSQVFRPTAAMEVTIQTSVAIRVGDEKAISIPPAFLVEHDGRSFLKFRPTGYQIVQLVCGCDMPKNSSLANSISLDQLLKKRNHEWLKPSCGQDVFQEADQKPGRKRKQITNPELITIDVNGQAVECLMQGQRPN